MQLNPVPYSVASFSCDNTQHQFTAFASDLRLRDFDRLYDDACDTGIAIVNPRTGHVTRWYVDKTIYTRDNDIGGWEFRPTCETVRKHRVLQHYKVVIFND